MDIVEQLDAERKHNARCNTLLKTAIVDLCESQAREAALRKIVAEFELFETYDDPETPIRDALERIGSDDTALKEAVKQGQREALLEAADIADGYWVDTFSEYQSYKLDVGDKLRKMAGEIK
jgi:hypothetical protein